MLTQVPLDSGQHPDTKGDIETYKYFLPFLIMRAPSPPVAVPVLLVVVEVGGRVLVLLAGGLPEPLTRNISVLPRTYWRRYFLALAIVIVDVDTVEAGIASFVGSITTLCKVPRTYICFQCS